MTLAFITVGLMVFCACIVLAMLISLLIIEVKHRWNRRKARLSPEQWDDLVRMDAREPYGYGHEDDH